MKLLTPLFQRSEICGYKSPTPSRESLILPCRVAVRLPTEAVRVPIREVLLLPECPRHDDGKMSVEHWRGEYVGRRQENQILAGFQVQVEVHIHGSLEFIDLDLARRPPHPRRSSLCSKKCSLSTIPAAGVRPRDSPTDR